MHSQRTAVNVSNFSCAGRHSVALPELGRILLLAAGSSRLCVEAVVSALARECGASLLPVDLNFLETLTTAALGTQPKRPEAQQGGFMALLVSAIWSGGKHAFALDIVRAFCKRVRILILMFGATCTLRRKDFMEDKDAKVRRKNRRCYSFFMFRFMELVDTKLPASSAR